MFSDNGYYKKSIYFYEKNESCANESISMKIHASQTLPLRTHTHLYVLQKAKVKSAMSPTSIFVEILRKSYRIFNKSVGLFMLKKHTRCLLKKEREYFDNRQMHTRGARAVMFHYASKSGYRPDFFRPRAPVKR